MVLETKEMAAIFNALHDSYDLLIKQNGETLEVESFTSNLDKDFIIKLYDRPLDDKDIEIIQLKKVNKCLIDELEYVKIKLQEVRDGL